MKNMSCIANAVMAFIGISGFLILLALWFKFMGHIVDSISF